MEFLGNTRAKEMLAGMVKTARFPHAVLICGEDGVGKKTFARIMAQAILCESENAPCGVCDNCKKISSGNHPDVEEITEYKKEASFKVDYVREIKSRAYLSPNEAKKRVFLIANAECMTHQAQNALLKVLEEPPETAVFILTTQNREKLLTTVLSRVVTIALSPVDVRDAVDYVKKIHPDADERDIKLFSGNIGKALNLIENSAVKTTFERAREILSAIDKADKYKTLVLLSKLNSHNALPTLNALVQVICSENGASEEKYLKLSKINCAISCLEKSANLNLTLTNLAVNLHEKKGEKI